MTQLPPDYLSTTSPYNYDQPLPPVARTNAVTQVPQAKKITFYKSGDPQFGGVKMAINQRSFKSFNALVDDLSHRVPLPFGVRTITTPRGIHCISTLDQLEDGGCYLCSDKKHVTPINLGAAGRRAGPSRNSQPASDLKRAAQEVKREDHSTTFTQQRLRIPKKITLVKYGDLSIRRPIILNRRNARSFKTLLDEISEIMQFNVKKLYTVDGKKIDSMQALLHCPNVLMCVGRELFKPVATENPRKPSVEKLPSLTSRSNSHVAGESNEMNFGLKAKKSVIHPRSSMSNRSMRLSLSSEKSYPNGLTTSSENGASCSNNCTHSKEGDLVRSLVNDDIEKRVHVNKDGSLSVEMKVRFRLLNDETLQWSTQIKKSNLMNMLPCEESGIDEDNGVDLTEKSNPEVSSELDDSLYPCDADSYILKLDESESEEARCHNCGKACKDYDIWKNPMHMSQKEEPGVTNTWYAHSSCSSTSSHRRIVRKKMASVDSIRTSSSGEYSEQVVRESSCYSETVESRVGYPTVRKRCCRCDCTKTNTSQRGSPEEPELVACSVNSPNEEDGPGEATVVAEGDEDQGSRARSRKSKSSRGSAESEVKVCEETSNVTRSSSVCSVQKEEVEDVVGCTSSPNSKPSTPIAKDTQDDVSENDQVILSFSNESCPKKENSEEEEEVEEEEVEKEEEETNEIHSVSDNVASSQSVKDEASECGRCSTQRSVHCETCNGSSRRSDSDEAHRCSAASSSSRVSKRSKHSQNHLETGSGVSAGSSKTSTTREKKTKSSLHAEDVRSNSKASLYSRSSQEGETRAVEGQPSHDSSAPRSNASLLSEAAVPPANNEEGTGSTSKCFSKSSKGSQKGSQQEATSKASSPCSSFSDSIEKKGNAQARSQSPSASMTESTCSKCGHMRKTRHDDLQSVHSRVSSHSEVKSKCAGTEASGRSGDAGSQSSVAPSSKPMRKKKNSLHADVEHSSRASASGSASVYSLHCPAPPKGRPGNRKGRAVVLKKNSNTASMCTESESITDKERKEEADSQAPEMDIAKGEVEEGSCFQKSHGEPSAEGDVVEGSEEVIPSSLPNTTPEEVVHEWLRNIPSETLLMKDEMQDDGEGSSLDPEQLSCSESQEPLEEEPGETKEDAEECKSTAEDEAVVEGAEEEALDEEGNKDAGDKKASEAMSEGAEEGTAACNQSVISSQNNHKKDLPSTIQMSVQIMKALLASKQEAKLDRSHSLPEVSPTMGRKLSNSANILITCLASLQLLDEELGPSAKADCLNRPRYTELLNIFQALWFEGASEKSGPSSGQHGEVPEKAAAGFKGHNSKEVTPMSSSGVDVSSGDGGSGEGSVAGTQERALPPEKTDEAEHGEEEANVGEEEEEEEEDSQLPAPCSKSEGGEQAESAGEEIAESQETLDSDCKIGQEEENEMTEEQEVEETDGKEEDGNAECEENHAKEEVAQEEAQEETVVEEAEDSPNQEDADTGPAEPSKNDTAPSASEANDAGEPESDADRQLVEANLEAPNTGPPQATVKPSPTLTQQRSIDPDPVWVLKLLKKIENEFLTHYVSAMNDFKVKWNLPNSEELDVMIAELKEDVSRRIEKSIEVELRKIRSRAGRRTPRPPDDGLQRESSVQAQHRRRRLQSLHKMSLFNGTQSKRPESRDSSHESDDAGFLFRTTIRDKLNEQLSEEEYCPCDACIKKKMAARATVSTVVVSANAPVVKAFDLQHILRMKKGDVERKADDGGAEGVVDEEATSSKQAGTVSEPEENQATEPSVEGEPGDTNEPEVKAAEAAEGEEAPESQTCEEVEGEEAANEVEEETKEEVDQEGNEEEEEVVKEEDENTEEEEKVVEEEETVKENEEAKEEETVKEDDNNEEKEAKEEEDAKDEEVEEAEEKEEEETVKEEEENEEEEAKEEIEETVKEEEEEEVEEAATNEEEDAVKEEDDNKEEEEAAKEEEEDEAKEEEETKEEEEAEKETEEEEEAKEEEDAKEEGEAEEEAKEEEEEAEEEAQEVEAEAKEEAEEEAKEEEEAEEEEEAKEEEAEEEGDTEEKEEEAEEEEEAKEELEAEEEAEEEEAEEAEAKEEEEAEEEAEAKEEEEEAEEEAEAKEEEEEEEEKKEEEEADEAAKEEEEEEEAKEEEEAEEEAEAKEEEEEEEAKEEEEADEAAKEEEEAEEEANEEEEAEVEAEATEEEETEEKAEEETVKEEEDIEEANEEVVDAIGEEEIVKEEEDAEEEEEAKEEEVEEPEAKEEEDTIKQEEEAKEEEEEEAKEEEVETEEEEAEEEAKEEEETKEEEVVEEEKEEEEAEKETAGEEEAKEEEDAKEEGEAEEEAKEMDEDATHSEEAEEDSKMEDETEGVEAEGGDNEAGEEAEEEPGPEVECEACLEEADVEDEGEIKETGEAEGNGEEAEGEDNDGTVQDDQEEGGKEAEEDGTIEDAQSPRNGSALSRGSSMGNCSMQSQKGSEDGSDREDCKEEENVDNDKDDSNGEPETHTEAKSPKMYPDSDDEEEEEEEEDGASSQTSAVKGGEPQTNENEEDQASKKKSENSEAFDQDDLDF